MIPVVIFFLFSITDEDLQIETFHKKIPGLKKLNKVSKGGGGGGWGVPWGFPLTAN